MAKINFYLKGAPSKKVLSECAKNDKPLYNQLMSLNRPIICSISFEGRRELVATSFLSSIQNWDSKRQEIKVGKETPVNRKVINESLTQKKELVLKLLEDANIYDRYVEKKTIQAVFKDGYEEDDLGTITGVLNKFIDGHRTKRGFKIKSRTKQKYRTALNMIVKYQKDEKFIPKRFTNEWVEGFKEFLIEHGLSDTTVAKYIFVYKSFKAYLLTIGIRLPVDFTRIGVTEREQIVNIIEQKELEILENYHYSNPILEQARDVFLFQCYTGQRYGDIESITRSNITTRNEHAVWLLNTQKTSENIVVPLNKKAQAILEKYKHLPTPLPYFGNTQINKHLKKVAFEAGLNRIIKMVYFYDNEKKEVTKPLHEAICSHMARKSFISLSILKGIPERYVRDVSGHKSEHSFRRYLNLGNSHLDAILNAWD